MQAGRAAERMPQVGLKCSGMVPTSVAAARRASSVKDGRCCSRCRSAASSTRVCKSRAEPAWCLLQRCIRVRAPVMAGQTCVVPLSHLQVLLQNQGLLESMQRVGDSTATACQVIDAVYVRYRAPVNPDDHSQPLTAQIEDLTLDRCFDVVNGPFCAELARELDHKLGILRRVHLLIDNCGVTP